MHAHGCKTAKICCQRSKKKKEIAQSFSVSHTLCQISVVLCTRMCSDVDECVFVSVSEGRRQRGRAHQALSQGPWVINNKARKAEWNMDYGYLTEQERDADCTQNPFPSVAGAWVVNFNVHLFRGIYFQGHCNKKNHLQSGWNIRHKRKITSSPGVQWQVCWCRSKREPVELNMTEMNKRNLETRQYEVHFECWVLSFFKNGLAGRKSWSYDG